MLSRRCSLNFGALVGIELAELLSCCMWDDHVILLHMPPGSIGAAQVKNVQG